jgi:hypothetical protein
LLCFATGKFAVDGISFVDTRLLLLVDAVLFVVRNGVVSDDTLASLLRV